MDPVPLEPSAADRARWARYREYLAFWEGRQWPDRARPGETRLVLNYARALVRKVTSVLFSRPVRYSVPDSAAAERYLAQLASEDDWHGLDYVAALDAAVLGDAAFKVTWDRERRRPRLTTVDPAQLVVATRPDDQREVVAVAHTYPLTVGAVEQVFGRKLPLLGPDGWVTVREEWTAERYRLLVGEQLVHEGRNPYGWIPYVLLPNTPIPGDVWGESDLADLLDVCREINRRMTVLSRILQVSGNPIVVLENVTASEGIRAEEGAIWELPEGSRAYLLDMLSGGGVALHLEYVRLLFQVLHDLAEVPRAAFGDHGRDLSGAALELELQPLVHKVERKRRAWERALRQRTWRVLDLVERFGGVDLAGARAVELIWGPTLPVDEERAARIQVALVGAGIRSRLTAARELGSLDPEAELGRVQQERSFMEETRGGRALRSATSQGVQDQHEGDSGSGGLPPTSR
ncbi:hypothetical protein HRbin28_00152 [bacterium HR28]|nr:hypothetical protein HRbin28_00152 [bacterium HR28]